MQEQHNAVEMGATLSLDQIQSSKPGEWSLLRQEEEVQFWWHSPTDVFMVLAWVDCHPFEVEYENEYKIIKRGSHARVKMCLSYEGIVEVTINNDAKPLRLKLDELLYLCSIADLELNVQGYNSSYFIAKKTEPDQ